MNTNNNSSKMIFPSNITGCKLDYDINSNLVAICGDYHGRYEDDDASVLCYDLDQKKFRTFGWTTRGYVGSDNPWNMFSHKYRDINDCDDNVVEAIKKDAKEVVRSKKDDLVKEIQRLLFINYPKSYSKKSVEACVAEISKNIDKEIESLNELPVMVSLFYHDFYHRPEYYSKFFGQCVANSKVVIKDHIDRKPSKVYLSGDDFTGKVISVRPWETRFGMAVKVGLEIDGNPKSVWAIINPKSKPNMDETITINGIIGNETEKSITLFSAKRIDNVDPELLVR